MPTRRVLSLSVLASLFVACGPSQPPKDRCEATTSSLRALEPACYVVRDAGPRDAPAP